MIHPTLVHLYLLGVLRDHAFTQTELLRFLQNQPETILQFWGMKPDLPTLARYTVFLYRQKWIAKEKVGRGNNHRIIITPNGKTVLDTVGTFLARGDLPVIFPPLPQSAAEPNTDREEAFAQELLDFFYPNLEGQDQNWQPIWTRCIKYARKILRSKTRPDPIRWVEDLAKNFYGLDFLSLTRVRQEQLGAQANGWIIKYDLTD